MKRKCICVHISKYFNRVGNADAGFGIKSKQKIKKKLYLKRIQDMCFLMMIICQSL